MDHSEYMSDWYAFTIDYLQIYHVMFATSDGDKVKQITEIYCTCIFQAHYSWANFAQYDAGIESVFPEA